MALESLLNYLLANKKIHKEGSRVTHLLPLHVQDDITTLQGAEINPSIYLARDLAHICELAVFRPSINVQGGWAPIVTVLVTLHPAFFGNATSTI